jgi:hypothetical protein
MWRPEMPRQKMSLRAKDLEETRPSLAFRFLYIYFICENSISSTAGFLYSGARPIADTWRQGVSGCSPFPETPASHSFTFDFAALSRITQIKSKTADRMLPWDICRFAVA